MIEGVTVHMAGMDWVVPPLSFKALKRALPALAQLNGSGGDAAGQIDALVAFLHAALQRNYPDLTLAELEDWLEVRDRAAIMEALPKILQMSGLTPQGESSPLGEVAAAL